MSDTSVIELRNVNLSFENKVILNQVNFRLNNGEFAYLIGPTGIGKSSFLKLLYRDIVPDTGSVRVTDYPVNKISMREIPFLRRRLGIVFQDFNLLMDRNVNQNLRFVLAATGWKEESKIKKRIQEVLKQVDLEEKLRSLPHQLSGGEQQRVVIARALLNRPQLIIADEPTGNLDPETSDDILGLLRLLAQKNDTAVLFATHDYRILENFPARIIRCVNGKIVEEEDLEIS